MGGISNFGNGPSLVIEVLELKVTMFPYSLTYAARFYMREIWLHNVTAMNFLDRINSYYMHVVSNFQNRAITIKNFRMCRIIFLL